MESVNKDSAASTGRTRPARAWLEENAAIVVLGLVLFAAAAVLLWMTSGLTYYQDTWAFLMHRRGFTADAFLEPHNEHIVLIPVAIVKLLLAIFGMTSALPEFLVLIGLLSATAILVFIYVRRRLGPWPAVIAATLLLFLGPAWQVLLWPFETGFVGAVMAGIAMLLTLEREDRRGDLYACGLLVVSLGFSTLGLSFALAAVVDVLLGRRDRGLRRAFVFILPLVLFALWYLGWGHTAESHLTLRNILESPRYLFDGLASSLDSLLGLSTIDVSGVGQPDWGRPLLVAAIGLVGYGQYRRPGFSPRLWPVAAATASFWLLAGFNYIPGREAVASRYTYAGSVFLLLLAADLLRGVRFSRAGLWVGGTVAVLAAVVNLVPLDNGRDQLRTQTVLTRSDLAAMNIAERRIDPSFSLTPDIAGTPSLIDVDANEYFDAKRQYGSPAYTPRELADADEVGRRQADIVLARALGIAAVVRPDSSLLPRPGCDAIAAGDAAKRELRLAPGLTRVGLSHGPDGSLSLRRFAVGEYPVATAAAPGGSVTLLRIPPDRVARPWHLHIDASQAAVVCH